MKLSLGKSGVGSCFNFCLFLIIQVTLICNKLIFPKSVLSVMVIDKSFPCIYLDDLFHLISPYSPVEKGE